ncbi:hypothetical protein [Pistachio virus Y]|uniref:Uncharacterized protein n=1 Tax=Pistachio virus Y TaxID=2794239 RepID=A0A7T0Q738_9VIRU|nr:hypothetical protein [Pistachio virus Y]
MITFSISEHIPSGFLVELTQLLIKYGLVSKYSSPAVKKGAKRAVSGKSSRRTLVKVSKPSSKTAAKRPKSNASPSASSSGDKPAATYKSALLKVPAKSVNSNASTSKVAKPSPDKAVKPDSGAASTSSSKRSKRNKKNKKKQQVVEDVNSKQPKSSSAGSKSVTSFPLYYDLHDVEGEKKPYCKGVRFANEIPPKAEDPTNGRDIDLNESNPLASLQFLLRVHGIVVRHAAGLAPVVEFKDRYEVILLPHSPMETTTVLSKDSVAGYQEARSAAIVSQWDSMFRDKDIAAMDLLPRAFVSSLPTGDEDDLE